MTTDAATPRLDETHDPSCVSWVEGANAPDTDFPLANLPFGIFRHDYEERPRVGIAIGDHVLDCLAATRAGLFGAVDPAVRDALTSWTLNPLMALGRGDARDVRRIAHRLLQAGTPEGDRARPLADDILASVDAIGMRVPAEIGDFTDFDAPPGRWTPVGHHGRTSSIVPTGTPVRRPLRPVAGAPGASSAMAPSAALDYGLDVGALVARGHRLGVPVALVDAEEQLFGLCLMNDWSARDLEQWEGQPRGPFLSKSFATTVSPWVVTLDALAPFRVPAPARRAGDQPLLPYLDAPADRALGGFGITVEAWLRTAAMRAAARPAERISHADVGGMNWTFAQLIAHLTSGGCNLRPGDLVAVGMASGSGRESQTVLLDGDEVTLRGWCAREGFRRIGFGDCRGEVLPASS